MRSSSLNASTVSFWIEVSRITGSWHLTLKPLWLTMRDDASDWYDAFDANDRTSLKHIRRAFLEQYAGLFRAIQKSPAARYNAFRTTVIKRAVEDLRDNAAALRSWLANVLSLSVKVNDTYASEALRAAMGWDALPVEFKPYLQRHHTVFDLVYACCDLSSDTYCTTTWFLDMTFSIFRFSSCKLKSQTKIEAGGQARAGQSMCTTLSSTHTS